MPILVTFAELRAIFGIPYSRHWIRQLELNGKFPRHVPIGEYRIGWVDKEIEDWVDKEIEDWVAAKMKARDEGTLRARWPKGKKRKP